MTTLQQAAQRALEFCEFCWRDVALNDYAEEQRAQVEAALRDALAAQPQTTHITWDAEGRRMVNGKLAPEHVTTQPQEPPCPYIRSSGEGTHWCALAANNTNPA